MLILASTSTYRHLLLQRLGLAFETQAPGVDETALVEELPFDLVARLARQKAQSVADRSPKAIVIGSDQLAELNGQVIGKPGDHRTAVEQLSSFSGQTVRFLTAVSVQCSGSGFIDQHTDITEVCFRKLSSEEIESYLRQEKPYDCAGSFKSESLGVVLLERITSNDPTAIIGLPLIRTSEMLRNAGLQLP